MSSQLSACQRLLIGGSTAPEVGLSPHLLENIPVYHIILDEIVEDWRRAYAPRQDEIDTAASSGTDWTFYASKAFMELQPSFLKCLFSYAMFFVATERAYSALWAQLNRINREYRLSHPKQPQANALIKKVRTIRNLAVAHPCSNKVSAIDSYARSCQEVCK